MMFFARARKKGDSMNYFDRCTNDELKDGVGHRDLAEEVLDFYQEFQSLRGFTDSRLTHVLIQVLKGAFEQLNEGRSHPSFSDFLDFYQKEVKKLGSFLDLFQKEWEQKRQRKEMFLLVARDTEKFSMNRW
jgi:hypothetical protein